MYYETFKPEADVLASTLAKTVQDLSAQLPKIRHRLEVEKGDSEKLRDRIVALKLTTGEVYSDQNAYATFKVNLKKLAAELEASEEACRLIETEILPKKQNELNLAEMNLKIVLSAFMLRCRLVADERINDLLRECLNERQSFLDDFKKLYAEYGLALVISDESFCPSRWWTSDDVRYMRKILLMDGELPPDPNPVKTAAQASIPPVKAVRPAVEPVLAMQDEETTPDSDNILSEALSQAVEPEIAAGTILTGISEPSQSQEPLDEKGIWQ